MNFECNYGHLITISYVQLMKLRQCPDCPQIELPFIMSPKQSIQYEIILKIAADNNITVVSKFYNKSDQDMEFICPEGHQMIKSAAAFKVNHNCIKCAGQCPLQSKEKLYEYINSRGGTVIGTYINNSTLIDVDCGKGHIFKCTPTNTLKRGDYCTKCSKQCPIQARDELYELIINRGGNRIGEYVNASTPISVMCESGHIFNLDTNHFKNRGDWCTECKLSNGEQFINDILTSFNIKFERQYKLPNNILKYDFYLSDYNTLLEWDGEQHFYHKAGCGWDNRIEFEKRRHRDIVKIHNCFNYNYRMLRLDFTWLVKDRNIVGKFIIDFLQSNLLLNVTRPEKYQWIYDQVPNEIYEKYNVLHN